ncbi:O-acetyl-ADP-ribose deacetylase [Tissierella pigra]|uniref:O-acetyl-ADP-ribose deacetylase n=1 Tax=Tissierella pigra TaxID=2607614 RepID=A0A6N7Y1G4_9FIRM|nr:O-acetyl-ADP-ribose deacetylase [Tissierella pigra]MBU5426409.1 O-acetyl-ADP-ribose deacetylase [Tissierella pigra]MSU02328.1 O-acetyl-ADP-ribose deacetylase [Tissierella pigra]
MYIYKDTTINVLLGDITEVKVDAIVNAANNTLLGGGGVDGAIHRVGGKTILEQCKKIGGCPTGEARITTAGNLPSNYIIHTVGPIYKDGDSREERLLYEAYYNSLLLAEEYNIKSIAFPSISTGAYEYPIEKAMKVAVRAIMDFIDKEGKISSISFVLFKETDFILYNDYLKEKILQI